VYIRTSQEAEGVKYRPVKEESVREGDVLLGSAALDLTLLWLGLEKVTQCSKRGFGGGG
jgi:hypothetical protein